ncbi:unnamed protein product [Polarella glacialis]|uniref:Uncharacterized protein n=1 Tax=Polarella glacialis TaxID=89957 RepID=A0A813INX2_POLGL|nr:unnamed protein product [Polarella glacialis]|mmetsp:Transcript_32660/g.52557  ORF Transcript_32660/g.52557 Transcript_32660/m.52557 type:complete len:130 (+) Transcript_32660:91-480(+)
MPVVSIDTSANLGAEAAKFLDGASGVLSSAAGAPKEHIHITLRCNQMMTWGSQLAGVDGALHTAQIRVLVCPKAFSNEEKQFIVSGVGALLSPFSPAARTQFFFEHTDLEHLAIDGLLLPDLIARDAPK